MAKKKENEARFTAWTTTGMRVDANGTIGACALELFGLTPGKEMREKILKLMQERHERLTESGV